MGNAPASDLAAQTLALGEPRQLDWSSLITQVFRAVHDAVLLLTPQKEIEVIKKQPCKIFECFRAGEVGPIVTDFDPKLLGSRVGLVSQKGKKVGPNQDTAFFLEFRDGDGADIWMACVMDGHGPLGHEMSRLAMQWLPLLVVREPLMVSEPGQIIPSDPQAVFNGIVAAFGKLGPLLARASAGSPEKEMSGTTCVFTLCSRGLLHSANVGDSRAVLSIPQAGAGSSSLQLRVETRDLTRDHKPNDVEERRRIEAHGGEVSENRVWLKKPPWLGLNLSRSLGDSLLHEVGVSYEADVAVTFLTEVAGQFVLLASDGVWEFLSSEHVVESVAGNMSFTTAPDAATRLLRHATDRWHAERSNERDDITIIIVSLQAR